MGMFDSLGQALSTVGEDTKGWIGDNPEGFAVVLDQIGSRMYPGGAFAGVGTGIAQSQLMDKAAKKQEAERAQLMKLLSEALGKNAGAGAAPSAQQITNNLTPAHQPGPTKKVITTDEAGNEIVTTTETVPKKGGAEAGSLNLTDVLPLFNP